VRSRYSAPLNHGAAHLPWSELDADPTPFGLPVLRLDLRQLLFPREGSVRPAYCPAWTARACGRWRAIARSSAGHYLRSWPFGNFIVLLQLVSECASKEALSAACTRRSGVTQRRVANLGDTTCRTYTTVLEGISASVPKLDISDVT
jgi:hypothetical protein